MTKSLFKFGFGLTFTWISSFNLKAQVTPFEGIFHYNIRVYGKYAESFLADEPPNKMDMFLKGGDFIINETGGQKGKTFLYIADSNHTYIIDGTNKRAFKKDYYVDTTGFVPEAIITEKTALIYGETCQEYKAVFPDRVVYYYVSDKFRVDLRKFEGKEEARANFLIKGLDGRIPLKTRNVTPELIVELEVGKIELKKFDVSYFRIPDSFKLKGRDPR